MENYKPVVLHLSKQCKGFVL